MTHEATAPGGSEPIAVITPAADTGESLSISQAARALQAARKPKEPAAPVEQPQADPVEPPELAQANAEPVEEQPIGEDTPVVEPAEAQPIEPPRSWTKEAKEQWQALPRNTQEYLAQREQERDRELRRSQNEAADKLKGLTAKEQEVERAKQQYVSRAEAAVGLLSIKRRVPVITPLSTRGVLAGSIISATRFQKVCFCGSLLGVSKK